MKATKYLSLAALALMGTLTSCQSDDEATIARPANAVGINVTIGSLQTTRSNPASTDYEEAYIFNQGDKVCVSTEGQDPVVFQCDANQTWAEAEAGKFLLWTASEMTFKAYYPATEGTSMTNFTLPTDQSSADKIALADYMTREQTRNNEDGTDINLLLWRKTARVIVKIAGFGGQYSAEQQTVSNVLINSHYSAIADGIGTGDITAVTPYQQGTGGVNTTYTALVVPTNGDGNATFITLTDGLSNALEVKGLPKLQAGYSYTYNLTVGKNKIEVASVTVQEWTTGTTLTGGQAQEQTGPTYPIALSAVTADYLGSVVTTDGNVYATVSDATTAGKTAVAMIAYVSGSNGLAIALTDDPNAMDWDAATSATGAAAHTPKVTGYSWKLPSKGEWNQMFGAEVNASTANHTNLNNALAAAGGDSSKLQEKDRYWSSAVDDGGRAYYVVLSDVGALWGRADKSFHFRVRACLAFTVEQSGAAEGHDLSASAVGEIMGTDGKAYAVADKDNLPEGVTAAGMVAYKDGSNGLVIALADEANTMDWSTAKGENGAAAHTPKVTGYSWKLPSKDEWNQMFGADVNADNANYTNLNTAITNAGGTALQKGNGYWSSSEGDGDRAYHVDLHDGVASWYSDSKDFVYRVRACFAFTVEAAAGPVTYTELTGGEVLHVGDIINPSEQILIADNLYSYYIGGPSDSSSPYTVVRADYTSDPWTMENVVNEKADGNYYLLKTKTGEYKTFEGALPATGTSDGILVTFTEESYGYKNYKFSVHEP